LAPVSVPSPLFPEKSQAGEEQRLESVGSVRPPAENAGSAAFRDGSTHVVLEPLDFIARLAALVPRPRLNLTRFHGIFAPNFKHRHKIVPRRPQGRVDSDKLLAPMSWAQRLERVFAIDIETCPDCRGTLRVIASIEEPGLIAKIPGHVQACDAAVVTDARAPPGDMQEALRLN
jgi:hypothetical protein